MKLLLINSVCGGGSTGKIVSRLAREHIALGWDVRIGFGRDANVSAEDMEWAIRIGNGFSVKIHGLLTRLLDWHGSGPCSFTATKKFLRWAEGWHPNVVWLHNLHGYYVNYELLFQWIKQHPEIEVKWTLHDCWAFTGHCCHFLRTNCQKWMDGCFSCPGRDQYPATCLFENSRANWESKRRAFCGVKRMTLITPSRWLAGLTRESFLGEYPVEVIKNSIDAKIFKPTPSDFRRRFGLSDKKIILGVATDWDRSKGLQDFIELRELLGKDYSIVLVGLKDTQIKVLPNGIIGLSRTGSPKELAEMYSAADWFFNPTHEDTYPTVNLEAKACGCRIATYDVGGAAETVEEYDKAWVLRGVDMSPYGFRALLRRYQG